MPVLGQIRLVTSPGDIARNKNLFSYKYYWELESELESTEHDSQVVRPD